MGSTSQEKPLRVLVVSPYGTSAVTGGAEKWLTDMLTHSSTTVWRVLLLQPGPFRSELSGVGIEVDVHPTGPSFAAVLDAARRTAWLVRCWRPDLVVGNGVKAQLVAALATFPHRTPTVWVKHDYSFDRTLSRALGRLADTVVVTAEEVGDVLRRRDLVVINPPAQSRRPSERGVARRRLEELGVRLDSSPVLVMAGRLVPYKGVDDAIAALARPAAARWRLAVIGEEDHSAPGERTRLSSLAERLGVRSRVQLVPPVPGLPDLLAAFDALAVLTKPLGRRSPGREGFGMTAFEAMQAGVPVVAVEGSPVAARLQERAGLTVAPGAPDEVAAALGRLSDRATREAMGQAGRELVQDYPGPVEVAERFASVLRTAARPPGAGLLREPRTGEG